MKQDKKLFTKKMVINMEKKINYTEKTIKSINKNRQTFYREMSSAQ